MFSKTNSVAVLVTAMVAFLLSIYSTAGGQQPKEVDRYAVVRRAKAATALVELPEKKGFGTAFCIEKSGFFVTNAHVVEEVSNDAKVRLVLAAGEEGERAVEAVIVRRNEEVDLAILKAEGADHVCLELGDVAGMVETMPLTAFGFPFGDKLALNNSKYPNVSVSVGRITSLRKSEGKLEHIQCDASLNPGNSGGAVVNDEGKVIGVVRAGIVGTGVNFIIPVSKLQEMVRRPVISLVKPEITPVNMFKPARFEASVATLFSSTRPISLQLQITAGDGPPRSFDMERIDDAFVALVPPVPPPGKDVSLKVKADFERGSIAGYVADRAIVVGGSEFRLRDVASFSREGESAVVLHDGSTHAGVPEGLDDVAVDLGNTRIKVALALARRLEVVPPPSVSKVKLEVVASQAGEEVARLSQQLSIGGMSGGVDLNPLPTAKFEDGKLVCKLPSPVTNLEVGGGGRFLVLYMGKVNKLAVFDVNAADIVGYVPVVQEEVVFAAGRDSLILVYPRVKRVERWSLTGHKRELAADWPFGDVVKTMVMGASSDGPLLVNSATGTGALDRCQYNFLDVNTLRAAPVRFASGSPRNSSYRDAVHIRASGDGSVFGLWATSHSPQGLESIVLRGADASCYYDHTSVGHIVPNADGSELLTARGRYTSEAKLIDVGARKYNAYLPSRNGPFYFEFAMPGVAVPRPRQAPASKAGSLTVYLSGYRQPLAIVNGVEMGFAADGWTGHDFTLDKRIHMIPAAGVIATFPGTNDRIVLHRFDAYGTLEKSGLDYLFVSSQPPLEAVKGMAFRYQVDAKAKQGPVKFSLESGPRGMSITSTGLVTWKVPADFEGDGVHVIIAVRDAKGQERFHTFRLRVGS